MPVKDLAPALLALGDLFAEASTVVYPTREPVALSIKATDSGSFLVRLIIESESAWDRVVDIFTSDPAEALANLKEIVIGSAAGVFVVIRWIRNRRVTDPERHARPCDAHDRRRAHNARSPCGDVGAVPPRPRPSTRTTSR
jgi:hypothetical protein